MFKSVIVGPAVLAAYYNDVNFRKWEIPGLFPTEEAVLETLAELPNGARVLDFGCSTGRLLSRVVNKFECYGFEINTEAAAEAERKGIRLLTSKTMFEERVGTKFNAVIAVDVFEHLTEPTDLLTKLAKQLTPGGRLILSTGNAESPAARDDPANFWYFRTVEHVCMITRGYADFLADRLGMSLVQWKEMSHYRLSMKAKAVEWFQTLAFEVFHRADHRGCGKC